MKLMFAAWRSDKLYPTPWSAIMAHCNGKPETGSIVRVKVFKQKDMPYAADCYVRTGVVLEITIGYVNDIDVVE